MLSCIGFVTAFVVLQVATNRETMYQHGFTVYIL